MEELIKEIKKLKSGKCKDGSGLIAEMIKAGGDLLASILLDMYNEVIKPDATIPDAWKRSIISVVFKSGDAELPQNYRPITIIPLLYKLFSRLLYSRLAPILDKAQPPDQAGFRPGYSTVDHLFTFGVLNEKSDEWNFRMWAAALDFKKAFDTVEHDAMWKALLLQGVPKEYVGLLCRMYRGQTAQVRTDQTSKSFTTQRGTKQGDPLSSLLFNALLEDLFREIKANWTQKKLGIRLGAAELSNLRFADDVLLIAKTLPQLQKMLGDIITEARKRGLELHPDKTKILSNTVRRTGRSAAKYADVEGLRIEILPHDGSVKYLGQKISFSDPHKIELENQIAAAWRSFMSMKSEFTNKLYSIRRRLELFNVVVTPTALYGCATWALTRTDELRLLRAERRMLRMIIGHTRRKSTDTPSDESEVESWIDWVQRTTKEAELRMDTLNIENWTCQYRRRKWRFAGQLACGNHDKWSYKALHWMPELGPRAARCQGRPRTRWGDPISKLTLSTFGTDDWLGVARDCSLWRAVEEHFIKD